MDEMSSFEETLDRVLDPEGFYWTYAGEETQTPTAERTVQLRIDVPLQHVETAIAGMERDGWSFTEQPDEPSEIQQRLFSRGVKTFCRRRKSRCSRTRFGSFSLLKGLAYGRGSSLKMRATLKSAIHPLRTPKLHLQCSCDEAIDRSRVSSAACRLLGWLEGGELFRHRLVP